MFGILIHSTLQKYKLQLGVLLAKHLEKGGFNEREQTYVMVN